MAEDDVIMVRDVPRKNRAGGMALRSNVEEPLAVETPGEEHEQK